VAPPQDVTVVAPAPFVPPDTTSSVTPVAADPVLTVPGSIVASDANPGQIGRGTTVQESVTQMVQRAAELSDVYTSSGGFRTVVAKAEEPALVLFKGMPDQYVEAGTRLSLVVPADAFAHTQSKATVRLAVSQQDGKPLPAWISFDSQTGTFKGEVPAGQVGEMKIKITARDMQGREATAIFRINLGKGKSGMIEVGKPGLTDQLRGLRPQPGADTRALAARRA
jgi:hypothetical protein